MLKIKTLYWINGFFYILFGLFLFLKPELSLRLIIVIASIEIIISGILGVITAWTTSSYASRRLLFFWSLIEIILGIIFLLFPEIGEIIAAFFVVILGIWTIIKGIFIGIDAFKSKKANIGNWWLLLLAGIITIFLGIFLTTNAFLEVLFITVLVGLGMILFGLQMLIRGFQAKKKGISGMENIDDYDEIDDE